MEPSPLESIPLVLLMLGSREPETQGIFHIPV